MEGKTVRMRYRMRDKEEEGINREARQREIQREKTEGVTKGRARRRNGGKETKVKRQRGKIEGEKPDGRDIGHICRKGETMGEKGEDKGGTK